MLLLLILVPLVAIGGAVGWWIVRKPTEEVVIEDANTTIENLKQEAATFDARYQKVVQMIRTENPNADAAAGKLRGDMQQFMQDFDRVLRENDAFDEDNYLKEEFEGYSDIKAPVQTMIVDLAKQSGFGS